MKKKSLFLSCLLLLMLQVMSQNYHAVEGSSFAGSLGVSHNPASIVHTPYPWDINVLSFQFTSSTNAVSVLNYSYRSNPAKSQYTFNNGNYRRNADANVNLHLFNTRIALNRRQAIAFGMNLRGYASAHTGAYNYADTIKQLKSFLLLNERNAVLSANLKTSTWIELFGTYSQTIMEGESGRLNAGITVKVTRGISGAIASLKDVMVRRLPQNGKPVYSLYSTTARYGYSSNYDHWKNGNAARQNINDFIQTSQGSASVDLGVEYLVKAGAVKTFDGGDDDYYDYEWKIGLSLLDLGKTQYKYGLQSRYFSNREINISDSILQQKLQGVGSLRQFNDSINVMFTGVAPQAGMFSILNPARLVVNVDRWLTGNFYLNGSLSVNLTSLAGPEQPAVTELSLLSVTPRWETRRLGMYLPVKVDTKGRLMAGGAFKAGPLLAGIHNWANVLAKNKTANGGGYLALVIRPSRRTKAYHDKRLDCPKW